MIDAGPGRHIPGVSPSPSQSRPAASAGGFADEGDASMARTLVQPPADLEGRLISNNVHARLFGEAAPTQIGKYLILRRLGGGAMGDVYLGWHEDLERCDAIKLVRPSAQHDAGEQRRLLREAQALARLTHDHVIRVHDSGTHEARVYLAMEYVKGTTLTAWQRHRPWRAVVGAYIKAGRGLLAAHRVLLDDHERPGLRPAGERRGLVHRDFKPDNVLVGDDGRVQVADFGLAVPLPRDQASGTIDSDAPRTGLQLSSEAGLVGTPLYVSPEQLARRPADARSDQYSFCVALYEALYGQHPFYTPGATLSDTELPTDSRGPAGTTPPAHLVLFAAILHAPLRTPPRGPVPRRILRALARGLSRDPAARYPSMAELLADLEREPMRRLLWTVGAPLGVAAAFLGGYHVQSRLPDFCQAVGQEVAGLWDEPRSQRVRAAFTATGAAYAETSHDRVDRRARAYLDAWTEARQGACDATYVSGTWDRDLHARSMACLKQHLGLAAAALDDLETTDRDSIAGAVDHLEQLPPLTDCSSEALLRRTCAHEPADPETAQVRARITAAQLAEQAGRAREAAPLAAAAVAAAEVHGLPRLIVDARFTEGRVLTELARPRLALAALTAARAAAERAGCDVEAGDIDSHIAKLVGLSPTLDPRLGLLHADDSALKQQRTALEDPLRKATTLSDRALILERHGSTYPAAESAYREALALRGDSDDTRADRAINHLNLGSVLRRRERLDAALAELHSAVALTTAVYGPDHPKLWKPLFNLGITATDLGQRELAEDSLTRSLALVRVALGPDSLKVAEAHNALAALFSDQDDVPRAHEHAGLAAAICEEQDRLDAPGCLASLRLLADSHRRLGHPDQALALRERALAATEATGGPDLAGARLDLAESLIEAGRWAPALQLAQAARPGFAADDPAATDVSLYTGEALLGLDAPAQALEPLERALARSDLPGQRARVAWALARSLCAAGGDPARARRLAQEARDIHAPDAADPATTAIITAIDLWTKQPCHPRNDR